VLSKILSFLVNPVFWIAFFIILAIFFKNKKRIKCLWTAGILFLFFSNPFIINEILQYWEYPALKKSEIHNTYPVGIVLGGMIKYYNTEMNRTTYNQGIDRLLQGIDLYHEKKIKKILISGGSGHLFFPDKKEA